MEKIKVIIIGAGSRGGTYNSFMAKSRDKYEVVAIADPRKTARDKVQKTWNLPDSACYAGGWEEILSLPKMADLAVIATLDDMHFEPAMKAISLGYHLLLEKPVSQTPEECAKIALAAKEKGVSVLVCHVLRYTPFYKKVKSILMDGTIGDIMSAVAVEGVGNLHQSHSFVRGNWHSEKESTPMLIAKSCHDLDIIQWLMGKKCKRVQSFGELSYFCKENAPKGAPVRCADGGCPVGDTCPYNCLKLYYEDKKNLWFRGAAATFIKKDEIPTDEEVMEALKTTDYGLCVFQANNDVVDHQTVNMEFEGGISVTFSMNAFNEGGRYIRIFGTKGELYANAADTEITVYTFADKKTTKVPATLVDESINGGHGGGDEGIVYELYEYLSGTYTGFCAADIETSVQNHMIGFAAEKARHAGTVESLEEYMATFGM